ncbi:hypothetical protein [Halosimplex amylolyticum]|uniref:hypothetical protein n=1 Tax=Halosimplex amylolyticum TaxID=3396616 RepID=UPI003F55D17D
MRSKIFAVFAVFLAITAMPVASAERLNFSADAAPAPDYEIGDMTKSVHDMDWGQSADAVRTYENNSGETTTFAGEVNTSERTPYEFVYTDVNATDWRVFPNAKETISAVESEGEWSTATSDSSNVSPSVSSSETAPGVPAVRFATSGMGAGDTSTFTFSNFSITSDESKRFGIVAYDANTLSNADTYAHIRAVDSDGDYKLIQNVTATGEGYVAQEKLGQLSTMGSGDGTFDDVQKVEIVAFEGDVEIDVAGLNLERMSPYDLGQTKVDPNNDGTYTTVDVNETHTGGAVGLTALDTMGSAFSSSEIHSLTFPAVFPAEMLDSDDVQIERTADESVEGGQYPGYKGTATIHLRMSLPDQYDLSYSNVQLNDTQAVTSDRLLSVRYAEGVGDTAFANISSGSWSDITSSYTGKGDEVAVDDTIQPGQTSAFEFEMKLTPDQYDELAAAAGGAGGGATGAGGWGSNFPVIGGLIAAALATLKRLGGGSGAEG